MSDVLAPVALVFRRRSTLERLVLDAALEIGAGGEAVVYEVPGDDRVVAKVYHQPTIERARKLTLMQANPPRMPEGTSIAWPADLLLEPRGFAGFLMPRAEGPRLFEFYNPVTRRATAPAFHFGQLHHAGRNLAAAFHALHAAGYVVGDVNESNILVHPRTAAVTLVDADSFQVPDVEAGILFRSRVGKAEFTPPELQGVAFTDVDRAPEHDRFGLAVLLFLLLMEGTHPFAVRMPADRDALPVEDRIRLGMFPHARDDDAVHPPRMSPRFHALHPGLRALFIRAFVQGHADPSARPGAGEWEGALAAAGAALAGCAANPQHRYDASQGACPWCERAAQLGGRDPFPAGAVHAPTELRPRPRRARVAAPFTPPPAALAADPYADPYTAVNPYTAASRFGVTPPFQNVALGQASPAPYQAPRVMPRGTPAPAVFGADGLRNPLVMGLPSLALGVLAHGVVSLFGFLGAFFCLLLLVRDPGRHVRTSTLAVAVCLTLFVGAMAGLYSSASQRDYDDGVYTHIDPPSGNDVPLIQPDPAPAPLDAPPQTGRSMTDVLLADIDAAPRKGAEIADPGPAPEPGFSGPITDAYAVDRLPVLENRDEAARALTWFYPYQTRPDPTAENAMLWLHVSADGHVTAEGRQLIRSTSRDAGDAAMATVPYLRYTPATQNGHAVDVWITQRLVIAP